MTLFSTIFIVTSLGALLGRIQMKTMSEISKFLFAVNRPFLDNSVSSKFSYANG